MIFRVLVHSIGFSRAFPKEASGNGLSWAYAMKNDLLGKKNLVLMRMGRFNFPRLEKGIFLQKKEKCLASNGMTCVLPLSPIYTVTSFATAKDFRDYIGNLDSQDDSPPSGSAAGASGQRDMSKIATIARSRVT